MIYESLHCTASAGGGTAILDSGNPASSSWMQSLHHGRTRRYHKWDSNAIRRRGLTAVHVDQNDNTGAALFIICIKLKFCNMHRNFARNYQHSLKKLTNFSFCLCESNMSSIFSCKYAELVGRYGFYIYTSNILNKLLPKIFSLTLQEHCIHRSLCLFLQVAQFMWVILN